MTVEQYRTAFRAALERDGWLRSASGEDRREYTAWAYEHLAEAARFEPGDVLELAKGVVRKRRTYTGS